MCNDPHYSNLDVNIFSETRLYNLYSNATNSLSGYVLSRNDSKSAVFPVRPFGGMAVYSKKKFYAWMDTVKKYQRS